MTTMSDHSQLSKLGGNGSSAACIATKGYYPRLPLYDKVHREYVRLYDQEGRHNIAVRGLIGTLLRILRSSP